MYIYVTNNSLFKEPECLDNIEYIHVKCKASRSKTLIITKQEVNDPNVISYTKEDAQTLLNSWIDKENLNPPMDLDGNLIYQDYINLDLFI